MKNWPDDKSIIIEVGVTLFFICLFILFVYLLPDAIDYATNQDKMEQLSLLKTELKEKHDLYVKEQSEQYQGKLKQCKSCHKNP